VPLLEIEVASALRTCLAIARLCPDPGKFIEVRRRMLRAERCRRTVSDQTLQLAPGAYGDHY